ncbi:hypothetical protein PR048_027647 [Dryococelus australis]|uniref:Uncharacterized protein n=1 Tax=Dryococelus australis TaxID=614101 RepID=A0ABQ9GH46_9NEOP|nr:hypothetical protein PR048_027647 [Dryococelus australis]
MKGWGKREIPENTRRPTASSGTIPPPWWEASVLIAHPPRPLRDISGSFNSQRHLCVRNKCLKFMGSRNQDTWSGTRTLDLPNSSPVSYHSPPCLGNRAVRRVDCGQVATPGPGRAVTRRRPQDGKGGGGAKDVSGVGLTPTLTHIPAGGAGLSRQRQLLCKSRLYPSTPSWIIVNLLSLPLVEVLQSSTNLSGNLFPDLMESFVNHDRNANEAVLPTLTGTPRHLLRKCILHEGCQGDSVLPWRAVTRGKLMFLGHGSAYDWLCYSNSNSLIHSGTLSEPRVGFETDELLGQLVYPGETPRFRQLAYKGVGSCCLYVQARCTLHRRSVASARLTIACAFRHHERSFPKDHEQYAAQARQLLAHARPGPVPASNSRQTRHLRKISSARRWWKTHATAAACRVTARWFETAFRTASTERIIPRFATGIEPGSPKLDGRLTCATHRSFCLCHQQCDLFVGGAAPKKWPTREKVGMRYLAAVPTWHLSARLGVRTLLLICPTIGTRDAVGVGWNKHHVPPGIRRGKFSPARHRGESLCRTSYGSKIIVLQSDNYRVVRQPFCGTRCPTCVCLSRRLLVQALAVVTLAIPYHLRLLHMISAKGAKSSLRFFHCRGFERPSSGRTRLSEEPRVAPNSEVFRAEVRMEQRRNEKAGETGDPRENPPTSGIVRHDSHMIEPGSPRWEASRLTAEPPRPNGRTCRRCSLRRNQTTMDLEERQAEAFMARGCGVARGCDRSVAVPTWPTLELNTSPRRLVDPSLLRTEYLRELQLHTPAKCRDAVRQSSRFRIKDEVDRSCWLRTTSLRVPTLNCFSDTSSKNGRDWDSKSACLLEIEIQTNVFTTTDHVILALVFLWDRSVMVRSAEDE